MEQVLRVALVQLEIQIVHQRDLCRAMALIYKVALLAVWLVLKEAAVVVVVTTAVAAVLTRLDQSMAAAAVVQAT